MADQNVPLDLAIAVPTFIGSLLSFLATATAIILQMIHPPDRHPRHAFIINLLVSDLMNSLNNTISGAIALANGSTPSPKAAPSAACIANGWIGQASVQTIDFNILIISIIVLTTVIRSDLIARLSLKVQVLACVAAWVPGLITSNIALGLDAYGSVSGNWCWIRPDRLDLRYGLTHGWRIGIFVATIAIYTIIYIRLKKVFSALRIMGGVGVSSNTTARRTQNGDEGQEAGDTQQILVSRLYSVARELQEMPPSHKSIESDSESKPSMSPGDAAGRNNPVTESYVRSSQGMSSSSAPRVQSRVPPPPNIRKMLLMNGYPIAYIILWIPGIANRLAESVGESPRWLKALQASTQFIGLVNSLTYGISEQTRRQARERWRSRSGFSRT